MNKKNTYAILAVLSLVAAIVMYMAGKNSANLTELQEYWWMPLPLAAIFLLLSSRAGKAK
ncbi:MAG TPA: hypothetical protein VK489_06695 [Ferruginibacter sp.]|nr:hypothetical protein [Ferruginibacter sp.]